MKHFLSLRFTAILITFSCLQSHANELTNSIAQPSFYITAARGLSINNARIDSLPHDGVTTSSINTVNTPQFNIEIGYYFNDYIKAGTSTHFLPSSKKIVAATVPTQEIYLNTNTESYIALLNLYLHPLRRSRQFSPYLTGGIGAAFNKIDTAHYVAIGATNTNSFLFTNTSFAFAWQLGAGITYEVKKDILLDLSYKYLSHGKTSTKHASIVDPGSTSTALETGDDAPKLSLKNLVSQQISVGVTVRI